MASPPLRPSVGNGFTREGSSSAHDRTSLSPRHSAPVGVHTPHYRRSSDGVDPRRHGTPSSSTTTVQKALTQIALLRHHADAEDGDHVAEDKRRAAAIRDLMSGHLSMCGAGSGNLFQRKRHRRQRHAPTPPPGTPLRVALGLKSGAPPLNDRCAVLFIDIQVTYTTGPMRLHGVEDAIAECRKLLHAARRANAHILHIVHHAGTGSLYDVHGESGRIVKDLEPTLQEKVFVKGVPSAFHGTGLEQHLQTLGIKNLILCGFMTHCCVSSTARAAFNTGVFDNICVVASATATRSLPDADGDAVSAEEMQRATLAGIGELHANIVSSVEDIPFS